MPLPPGCACWRRLVIGDSDPSGQKSTPDLPERQLLHQPVSGTVHRLLADFAFFAGFEVPELFSAIAWRTSALKADSSTSSPS